MREKYFDHENEVELLTIEDEVFNNFFSNTYNYPPNFPNIRVVIENITLILDDFNRLCSNAWVNDNIINTFFTILQNIGRKNNLSVISFSTFCISNSVKTAYILEGFRQRKEKVNTYEKEKVNTYEILLIPINTNKMHWTLWLAIPSRKE